MAHASGAGNLKGQRMANDITTLAIEIQSQEAERNLRTFQELLTLSSQTAHKMEKVSIEVNAEQAISQLQTMREVYEGIAAAGKNIAFEMPKMPEITAVPEMSMQSDPEALRALQEFFETSREMSQSLREEMEQFSESMRKLEADTEKVSTAGGRSIGTMRGGMAVSREYAMAVRELNAAQREMEKAIVQADEAMKATAAADEDAAAVKKRLTQAQRELASVSKQLADTHNGMGGDIIGLSQKEDMLKNKVAELKIVYEEARGAAEKFNLKLEESAAKADAARAKYHEVKARLETLPQPVAQVSGGMDDFSKAARRAATQSVKMARGFNAVAFAAGASIPGLNKIGHIIGTFAYAGPVVGGLVVGVGALASAIKFMWDESQRGYRLAHEHAVSAQKDFQDAKAGIESLTKEWNRLDELESSGTLTNEQNTEAARIIEHLTSVYGDLGLEIDKTTGKLKGYSAARAEANERERQYAIDVAQRSVGKAEKDVKNKREQYEKSSATAKDYLSTLNGKSPEEILRVLENRKRELEDIQDGEKFYTRIEEDGTKSKVSYDRNALAKYAALSMAVTQQDWKPNEDLLKEQYKALKALNAAKDVDNELKLLGNGEKDGLIAAYKRLAEAKGKARDVKIKPIADYNIKKESFAKRGLDIDSNGYARLLTEEEKYARKKEELHSLELKIADETKRRGKNSDEYYRLEAKRLPLLYSILQYEGKITKEKDRQAERVKREEARQAERVKREQEREDVKWKKTGEKYRWDEESQKFVKRERGDQEKRLDSEQKKLYEEMFAMARKYRAQTGRDFSEDMKDGKLPADLRLEFSKKRNQYADISIKKEKLQEDAKREQEQVEAIKRPFVYDKNGNIIREKSEKELAETRKQEIAALQKKLKNELHVGTPEYYKAQKELERLKQEEFRERQKSSFSNVGFSQMQAHNSMVQGIEAKSSQALRLESRNFNKPDNVWKSLEKIQTKIYDHLNDFKPNISAIAEGVGAISGNVTPL